MAAAVAAEVALEVPAVVHHHQARPRRVLQVHRQVHQVQDPDLPVQVLDHHRPTLEVGLQQAVA